MEEKIDLLMEFLKDLKYYEWKQIEEIINKKYSQISNKSTIEDIQEFKDCILKTIR